MEEEPIIDKQEEQVKPTTEPVESEEEEEATESDKNAEKENPSRSIQKIKDFTEENENSSSSSTSLRSILGGDFLNAAMVRKQLPLIILIAICCFVYISNRYSNQIELIEIDKLKNQLDDARYNALTRSSELTAKSRQSYIEDYLRNSKDSTLQISTNPPYVIHLNKENALDTEEEATTDSITVEDNE